MKFLAVILSSAFFHSTFGQSPIQNDVREVIATALDQNKLPKEIVVRTRPTMAPWTTPPFVVVKSDDKQLKTANATDNSRVWFVSNEDIFINEITFALVPTKIKRRKSLLIIEYKTVKYPGKETPGTGCHAGKLIAQKKKTSWVVLKSEGEHLDCEVRLMKE